MYNPIFNGRTLIFFCSSLPWIRPAFALHPLRLLGTFEGPGEGDGNRQGR